MQEYKREFIDFMVRSNVLTFGDFTTKSGRKTPFFINTGNYDTGEQLARLGVFYARALNEAFRADFDCLFGPAYKGIPLVATAAVELATQFAHNVHFCFNRKEVKDHGEGGSLVGHKLADGERVIIVEDVTTAGTSVHETMPLLTGAADVTVIGLIVSVDRQERGTGERTALAELQETYGFRSISIVNIDEIVEHLHNRELDGTVLITDELKARIDAYREEYGAKE